jgi:hypothetical protein
MSVVLDELWSSNSLLLQYVQGDSFNQVEGAAGERSPGGRRRNTNAEDGVMRQRVKITNWGKFQ